MNREEALQAVRDNVKNENIVRHMLATEVIMQALARRLGEDEEEWRITGLIHDIDLELMGDDPSLHGKLGADLIKKMGASETMAHALLTRNETLGVPLETKLDKALFCADPLTRQVMAAARARPDKKLAGVEVAAVKEEFKKQGAPPSPPPGAPPGPPPGATQEEIAATCSELGLEFDELIELGLKAMQGIAAELGL